MTFSKPIKKQIVNNNVDNNLHVGLLAFLADLFIIFFGSWTLVQQITYFAGLNFSQSWKASLITSSFSAFLFATITLKRKSVQIINSDPLAIWVAILISVALTLFLRRPDSDDELYFAHAILALDFPLEKMKSLQGISTGYALTSYDFIRAAISYFSGMPVLYAFYVVGPTIISIVMVIFQARLLKLISVKNIGLSILIFFIAMLAWGDIHRSPANLGYVKLFQGKGALVWVAIPAMLFYWLEFEVTRKKEALLLLVLSAIAGVGFSATGIPIAILMAVLFFASGLIQIKNKHGLYKRSFFMILILACLLSLGFLIIRYFNYQSSGIHTSVGTRQLNNLSDYLANWEMLHFVLGNTMRFWIALFSLVICPFILPPSPVRKFLQVYLGLCILLISIPFSSAVMAEFSTGSFAWRWLFICPFVLAIMIFIDFIYGLNWKQRSKFILSSIILLLFVASGPLLLSKENHTELSLLFHQLPDEKNIVLRPAPYYGKTTSLKGSRVISTINEKLL